MSKKTLVDSVNVASPCSEDWERMYGDERIKFCSHCSKSVNNLTAISRKEALRLVRSAGGDICIRYIPDPATGRPLFAEQFVRLTRQKPGFLAGVMSASLTISTVAYGQEPASPTPVGVPTTIEEQQPSDDTSDQQETETQDEAKEEETPEAAAPEETPEAESETEAGETPAVDQASVEGYVFDETGAGVSGVGLIIFDNESGSSKGQTATDKNGYYDFGGIGSGTYLIEIYSVNGLRKAGPHFTVSRGGRMQQNLHVLLESPNIVKDEDRLYDIGGAMAMIEYSLPLTRSVSEGNLELVKKLLSQGEEVNGTDKNYDNITPLFIAVENGRVDITRLLLEHGADVNAASSDNQTPLMYLDSEASPELVRVLLDAGANVKATNKAGQSVLQLIMYSATPEVVGLLINAGAAVNEADENGDTPLIKAASQDKTEICRMLLEAGADVNAKDKSEGTAWDATTKEEVEDLLTQYGAAPNYGNIVVARPNPKTR